MKDYDVVSHAEKKGRSVRECGKGPQLSCPSSQGSADGCGTSENKLDGAIQAARKGRIDEVEGEVRP